MANVRGLSLFATHFSEWRDHYVLIGGVAASLAMDEAGQPFRATKDLDIVLIVEALSADFVAHFWKFIRAGGYQIRQKGGERPVFYRFTKPEDLTFPVQIELFSRAPGGLHLNGDATLTPLPSDEAISSLSAILLDDDYYAFLLQGRQHSNEVAFINADRLIPFKVRAWLDLSRRKEAGEAIDSKNIRKHRNDILVLSGLLNGETISLTERISQDMHQFLTLLPREHIDLKALSITRSLPVLIGRLQEIFGITAKHADAGVSKDLIPHP